VKVAFDLRGIESLVPRPGAVIEVDRNTPPVLFHFGEGVRLERLPLGSRIVYPPDPLEPIAHPERAIKRALGKPLEDDPLKSLLRKGMKLTIRVRRPLTSLPPMAAPDVRQLVMEEVIDMAAEMGIEDIHLIAALGLHRRMGRRTKYATSSASESFSTFWPDRLYQHDGVRPRAQRLHRQNRTGGRGHAAQARRRIRSPWFYVNLTLVPMDGGHKSMSTGLASYRGIRAHHNTPKHCWVRART